MSAVFEITIFSRQLIPNDLLLDLIKKHHLTIDVDSIDMIDNWEYDNQVNLDPTIDMNLLNGYIKNNKIVMLSGLLNNKYRCGHTSEMKKNNIFLSSIWISSKGIEYLDKSNISTDNELIYNVITNEVIKVYKLFNVFLCGIGVESYINYSESIESILVGSKNINRWIFSNQEQLDDLYGFIRTQINDFVIFSHNG